MLDTGLTVGELASLANVPVGDVKKFIKELTDEYPDGRTRFPKETVMLFSVGDPRIQNALKFQIKEKILKQRRGVSESNEEVYQKFLDHFPKNLWNKVQKYIYDRAKFIVEDPEILGGTPVIKGTRVTVHSIRGRLKGGEKFEDLINDYPYIPTKAFEVANLFAKSNPNLGRPKGWATLKPISSGNYFKKSKSNPSSRNGSTFQ